MAGNGAAPILITWAATSQVKADRAPIGKVWTASGKWPVTAAVQRAGTANTYAFETVAYRDLEEAASGIFRRIEGGLWTMVAGAPRPELDLSLLARRLGSNFHDVPTTLFIIDVDGLTPDKGEDLSKPDHFGDAVVDTIRARRRKRASAAWRRRSSFYSRPPRRASAIILRASRRTAAPGSGSCSKPALP